MLTHLLIMRHAKSSWKTDGLPDHQRPLNKRGERSADAIASALVRRGFAPDKIWSSDATRTTLTAKRMIEVIPGAQTILYNPALYLASAEKILLICGEQDEPEGKLMLLGHNPGMGNLFEHFTGRSHRFPTASCAIFTRKDENTHWLSPHAWQFKELLQPRELLGETIN